MRLRPRYRLRGRRWTGWWTRTSLRSPLSQLRNGRNTAMPSGKTRSGGDDMRRKGRMAANVGSRSGTDDKDRVEGSCHDSNETRRCAAGESVTRTLIRTISLKIRWDVNAHRCTRHWRWMTGNFVTGGSPNGVTSWILSPISLEKWRAYYCVGPSPTTFTRIPFCAHLTFLPFLVEWNEQEKAQRLPHAIDVLIQGGCMSITYAERRKV